MSSYSAAVRHIKRPCTDDGSSSSNTDSGCPRDWGLLTPPSSKSTPRECSDCTPSFATARERPTSTESLTEIPTLVGETLREICRRSIRQRFPAFNPRNDFDILRLAQTENYRLPPDIYHWLNDEFRSAVTGKGDVRLVLQDAKVILDQRVRVIGMKPSPGAPIVSFIAIPGSPYAVRLWPGPPSKELYFLDFVCADTERPLNTPKGFELHMMVGRDLQRCGYGSSLRLYSLECQAGYSEDEITAGAETYWLRDGQHCRLKHPTFGTVDFIVPDRTKDVENETAL